MRTPEQLKGQIRHFAETHHLMSQEVLQMYLFERILARLSASEYADNFILKGGLLISSVLGISERTTMDMDTTVTGITMTKAEIERVVQSILMIDVHDDIRFVFKKSEPIRTDDEYQNFRIYLTAEYGKINNPMTIDITTGDKITPAAIRYSYRCIMDDTVIPVMAYSPETVIAEKYETIIRRNIGTTRARDFYDLRQFFELYKKQIDKRILQKAILQTAEKHGSLNFLNDWEEICTDMKKDENLKNLWANYVRNNSYASEFSFEDVVLTVEQISLFIR